MKNARLFAPLLVSLLASCAASSVAHIAAAQDESQELVFVPRVPAQDPDFDWVRMNSGEWLKGKLTGIRQESVEFDSEEFDDVSLDLEDIAELRISQVSRIRLFDERVFTGRFDIVDGELMIHGDPRAVLPSTELMSAFPGEAREANYWSGDFSLGFTGRSGNSDQLDSRARAVLKRETILSRLVADYDTSFSKTSGTETANSHRFTSSWDIYIDRKLFVRPAALEVYRDKFQNIAWRFTPSAGAGYKFYDRGSVMWEGFGGLAYVRTDFDSVQPGKADHESETALKLNTTLEWEVTPDFDWDFFCEITVPFDDADGFRSRFESTISVDLVGSLDLDTTFTWERDNDPELDQDAVRPEKDDFRLTVSFAYDF